MKMNKISTIFSIVFIVKIVLTDCEKITQQNNDLESKWSSYQSSHKLKFNDPNKESKSFDAFKKNSEKIENHNKNQNKSYTMGENKFAHLPYDEFRAILCGTLLPQSKISNIKIKKPPRIDSFLIDLFDDFLVDPPNLFGNYSLENLPASLSYKHLMQPVQDQQNCSACWSFATISQLGTFLISFLF